ncbi:hypothetical protein DL96DRAFT_1613595 [Flagelloscypha sp. PMI_526]|nr:hypothetical protein DL96DRAFT_1613595 [Flagelloscypha sp. PMI_526]
MELVKCRWHASPCKEYTLPCSSSFKSPQKYVVNRVHSLDRYCSSHRTFGVERRGENHIARVDASFTLWWCPFLIGPRHLLLLGSLWLLEAKSPSCRHKAVIKVAWNGLPGPGKTEGLIPVAEQRLTWDISFAESSHYAFGGTIGEAICRTF